MSKSKEFEQDNDHALSLGIPLGEYEYMMSDAFDKDFAKAKKWSLIAACSTIAYLVFCIFVL